MAEPRKPDDERIEELLSQLQGIFGKLSQNEEEESQKKEDVPSSQAPLPPPPVEPATEAPPVEEVPPIPHEAAPLLEPMRVEPPPVPVEPPVAAAPPPAATPAPPALYTPPPVEPPAPEVSSALFNAMQTPTAVFFPSGRDAEARLLANRLESLTPRFTKITFALKVLWTVEYDPKAEWKDAMIARAKEDGMRAVFIILERPLDENRRKAIAPIFDGMQVYFQDVPVVSIEKRAFYTDMLLGMVFYFESLKAKGTDLGPGS